MANTEKDKDKRFETLFSLFALVGGEPGKLTFPSIKKWLMDAEVIGEKTGIDEFAVQNAYEKVDPEKKGIDRNQFSQLLEEIGKEKNVDKQTLLEKVIKLERVTVELPEAPAGADPAAYKNQFFDILFDVYSAGGGEKGKIKYPGVKKFFADAGVLGGTFGWCWQKKVDEKALEEVYEDMDKQDEGMDVTKFEKYVETLAKSKKIEPKIIMDELVKVKTIQVDMPRIRQ